MTSFEVNYLASTLRADIGCLFNTPLNYLYMVVPSQYAVESRRPFFSTFHIKLGGLWAGCISILAYIMHVFSFSGKHKTKTKHKIRGTGGITTVQLYTIEDWKVDWQYKSKPGYINSIGPIVNGYVRHVLNLYLISPTTGHWSITFCTHQTYKHITGCAW